MRNKEPTSQQAKVAAYIEDYQLRNQASPSHREIAEALGFRSTNSVRSHLSLMEKKGLLLREPGKVRRLRLNARHQRGIKKRGPQGIPLIGHIPAGVPFAALQELGEKLSIAPSLFSGDEIFALKVEGQSMRDAGILDGDIAILNRQEEVSEGQIAAVIIGNDATLKRFYRKGDAIVLRAANPDFADMVIGPEDDRQVSIAGRLVGVLRTHGAIRT